MLRKKKLYSRPRKAFETSRIKEENALLALYGLKNKREVWKALAKINYFRRRAQELARAPIEEQENLFGKLNEIGLKANSIADVLGLKVENLLERRLPTIVAKLGLASTVKHARQSVVHKKVLVNGNIINIPSYLVKVAEEKSIKLKENKKPRKKEEKAEEKVQKVTEANNG